MGFKTLRQTHRDVYDDNLDTYNAIQDELKPENHEFWNTDEKINTIFADGAAINPASLNKFTKAMLDHYEDIVNFYLENPSEINNERLVNFLDTFPRLWFNEVTDSANANDAALGELIKKVWTAVKLTS